MNSENAFEIKVSKAEPELPKTAKIQEKVLNDSPQNGRPTVSREDQKSPEFKLQKPPSKFKVPKSEADHSEDDFMDTSRPLLTGNHNESEEPNFDQKSKSKQLEDKELKMSQKVTSEIESAVSEENKCYITKSEVNNNHMREVITRGKKLSKRKSKKGFSIFKNKGAERQNRQFRNHDNS